MESNAKPEVNVLSHTSSNYVRPLRNPLAPNGYGNTRRKYRVNSWMRNNAKNPFFALNPPILPSANPPNSSAVKAARPSNLRRNAVLAARAKKVKVAGGSRKSRKTKTRKIRT
jgi:hypothetical protein